MSSNKTNKGDNKNKTSGRRSSKKKKLKRQRQDQWKGNSNFDYAVDYNDHFETPIVAYQDIIPLIEALTMTTTTTTTTTSTTECNNDDIIIYDPYYCNGRTKSILHSLGFQRVVHEKRDFYKDIENKTVPNYDIFITNPPYSDTHKERCLEFCIEQLRPSSQQQEQQQQRKSRPFFVLMPNYVAARNYYRRILGDSIHDVAYFVPNQNYEYDHPEGTGHEVSPFKSMWFCGVGRENLQQLKDVWQKQKESSTRNGRFVSSFDDLIKTGTITIQNRPNPRQRKKRRKLITDSAIETAGGTSTTTTTTTTTTTIAKSPPKMIDESSSKSNDTQQRAKKGKSRYRDENGKRIIKRF